MRDRIIDILIVICCIFLLTECSTRKMPSAENKDANEEIKDITKQAIEFADSVYNTLTLEERVGQCFMPAIKTDTNAYNLKIYRKYIDDFHVGGIVLMYGDINSARKLAEIGKNAKVPLFISIDAEWGLGMRLSDAPVFPINGRIKEGIEENLLFDYGREMARESRMSGINMILGPVIDVSGRLDNVIGRRSFGSDPQRVADLGISYAKGLESGGVISVAKHFPGHGDSFRDSHKKAAVNYKSITDLDSIDLYPFKNFITSGLTGIMAGHIEVPAINNDGIPASVSESILTTLLREEMGFNGLVITDAFNMGGANGYSGWEALKAGADLVLAPNNIEKEIKLTIEKIEKGDLDYKIFEIRCKRILFYKSLFGLWNDEIPIAENDLEQKAKNLSIELRGY